MLALQFIRENRDQILKDLAKRNFGQPELIDQIIALDQSRRSQQAHLDQQLSRSNQLAKEIGPNKNIVTILCDSGSRYQTKLYNRNFLINNDLPCPEWI